MRRRGDPRRGAGARRGWARGRVLAAAALWACAGLSACAGQRRAAVPRPLPSPAPPCAASAAREPAAAICGADAVQTLRARFRATVTTPDGTRDAEGVLLVRRPGAMRVKLFTLAGLTVYDALLVGDARAVRGEVSLPLDGRSIAIDLGPGEPVVDPEVGLALALWSLWQPRCATPPRRDAAPAGAGTGAPQRWQVDPAPALATSRAVTVAGGELREEELVRPSAPGAAEDRVVATYLQMDCALPAPLPSRIALAAPAQGWHADVRILALQQNPDLDPRLFAPTGGATDHGGA